MAPNIIELAIANAKDLGVVLTAFVPCVDHGLATCYRPIDNTWITWEVTPATGSYVLGHYDFTDEAAAIADMLARASSYERSTHRRLSAQLMERL